MTRRILVTGTEGQVVGSLVEIRADAVTKNQNSDVYYSLRFPRFKTFRTLNGNEKL